MSTYLKSIETAVSFIEDHLQEDITLVDIAEAVSYSLYHFCRIFNQAVHHPPYDYLMRRRLTAAAQQLVIGKQRISDIAFTYQFGSPETFSRAFRRMFGILPTQWRKQGVRDPRVLVKPISANHLAQRNQPQFQHPTLVKKPELILIGLMTIVQDTTILSQGQRLLPQAPTHIIHHYPDYWQVQGKPILLGTVGESAHPPLVSQTIPAYEYACFLLPERIEERPLLTDYIYQTWLPQSSYKLAAPLELEIEQRLLVPITPDA
jgi:AraC family transcriptional regulator